LNTLNIEAPEEGFRCSSWCMLLHVSASLATKCYCLQSKVTCPGVTPDYLTSGPHGVVRSKPKMDVACRLRRSWRSSPLRTSLRSHHSTDIYSATAWTYATWPALTMAGTITYIVVSVRTLPSADLAFFIHRLFRSLNVRCASFLIPSKHVTCVLSYTNLLRTVISAVSFGLRCIQGPLLRLNGTG
jgi:hypothetical protein